MPDNRKQIALPRLHQLATRLRMKHLLLLRAIHEHGSLTRVAEYMATSQPAVTQMLADLEALFGAPLFTRSVRGMYPTALGKLALSRAETMLVDLNHWVLDLESATQGHAAHLHIGVIPFLPGRLLAHALNQTRPNGQRVTVTLHEDTSDNLLVRLRAHELDCVIGRTSAVLDMEGLSHEILYEQAPRLIAHQRLARQLNRKPLEWKALINLDWILGARQTPMREQIADFFLRAGVQPPIPLVETLSAKLIGELIAANDRALSIVPEDIAEELTRIAKISIVQHRFNWTLPPITLFQRQAGADYPEKNAFIDALRHSSRTLNNL